MDVNKSQEGKTNLSGRTELSEQARLEKYIRKAGMRAVITKTHLVPHVPFDKWINTLKSQFTNYKKGEG